VVWDRLAPGEIYELRDELPPEPPPEDEDGITPPRTRPHLRRIK
jgi:hypothetical protein